MRLPTDADLVVLWETGQRKHPLDRALLALQFAWPATPGQSLADWPFGRRNRALIELRCATFGPSIQAWIACPQCRERLEFDLDLRPLLAESLPEAAPDRAVQFQGRRFRLPSSRIIARAADICDPLEAAVQIAESCRVEQSEPLLWTDEELEELGEKLAEADPLAETLLALVCPECAHRWDESMDAAAFLWSEIEDRAQRALAEVHALAAAYGWSEHEILSLSRARRDSYLEMVRE